ncbi:helix-turn-helix transcriptional regulator [Virgibacillus sp. SK37]|uniref:helix-turn-helix domain-containing protein n=1 Tax=Virgibacillus sp. SK37 TaxID=403957 RepID=UPI0004D1A9F0|nr:helix-turn-helix domain-containing protein [Virgibacillus sp. SK37]AIF43435.1 XRE family transcriptional regulator [Virgibacillus sp. SK37]
MATKPRRKPSKIKPSYKPFEKTLIDRDVKKVKLKEELGISPSTLHKMKHNEYVALDVIGLLCEYLRCNINDIVEFIPVEE